MLGINERLWAAERNETDFTRRSGHDGIAERIGRRVLRLRLFAVFFP
jgi:hypothetical protein